MSADCGATDADGAVSEKDTPTGEKDKRTTTGIDEMIKQAELQKIGQRLVQARKKILFLESISNEKLKGIPTSLRQFIDKGKNKNTTKRDN